MHLAPAKWTLKSTTKLQMQIPRNATMMMMQSKNISSDRKINLRDAITKIFPNAWQQTSEYYVACTETQHSMRDEAVEGGRRRREQDWIPINKRASSWSMKSSMLEMGELLSHHQIMTGQGFIVILVLLSTEKSLSLELQAPPRFHHFAFLTCSLSNRPEKKIFFKEKKTRRNPV